MIPAGRQFRMVIYLIGFMGSGKTYWAEKLSAGLHVPWFDLDRLIEEREGAAVRDIFAEKGEDYFRDLEHEVLKGFSQGFPDAGVVQAILSCGGGAPCFHDNMGIMNNSGKTVWLNPPVSTLAARLARDSGERPLLAGRKGQELENFISLKLDERRPWYRQATVVIEEPMPSLQGIINTLAS